MRRRAMPSLTIASKGRSGGHFGRPNGTCRRAWRAYSKTRAELPTCLFAQHLLRTSEKKTAPSGSVQLVSRMQGAHGELGVFGGHQDADLDLRCGDHLDVYPLGGQ